MISNENVPKICFKYYCEKCHYGTCKTSSYHNHLKSRKHLTPIVSNVNTQKIGSNYICSICNKIYKDNSGLWRHKKKCTPTATKLLPNDTNMETNEKHMIVDKELVMMLFKQNTELLEIIKNGLPIYVSKMS